MGEMTEAKKFWKEADFDKLGRIWNYDKKLPYEMEIIEKCLNFFGSSSIWDAACGDGRIAKAINGRVVFCSDLRGETGIRHDLDDGIPDWLPLKVDTVLLLGVIQFLTDESLLSLLEKLKGRNIIIRTACDDENTYINRYSDELSCRYESLYRSLESVKNMLCLSHDIFWIKSVYPEQLESVYGTRQYILSGGVKS